ncbi:MAG: lipoyl(octanoyl) transferase LipB [Myxococcota bacterium]
MQELAIVELGTIRYREAWALQKQLHALRVEGHIPDTLLLLTHPHVLTTGSCKGSPDRWANLSVPRAELEQRGVDLVEVDRGGDITWHGPGQLVGYPIVDLSGYNRDVGRYVRMVEAITLRTLDRFGVVAERQKGYTGVWIGNTKISAIGVRIRGWVSMHGFSLNIRGALEGFDWIVPCGLDGRGVTSLERQLAPKACPSDAEVVAEVITSATSIFERRPHPTTLEALLAQAPSSSVSLS